MTQLSISELYTHYQNLKKDELILDVRSSEEFLEVRIPGAQNKDYQSVAEISEELQTYRDIYIYCRRGGRAEKAFLTLQALGHKNIHYVADGGIDLWYELGYPTEKTPKAL